MQKNKRFGKQKVNIVVAVIVGVALVIAAYFFIAARAAGPQAISQAGPIVSGLGDRNCLDNDKERKVNDNRIQFWDCNGGYAQQWTLWSDNTIRFGAGSFCVDVKGASTTSDTPVQLYWCNGTAAQVWNIDYSNHTVVNPQSGLCLNVRNSDKSNGAPITVSNCNGTAAQKWYAPEKTGNSTPPPAPNPTPTTPPPVVVTPPTPNPPTPTPPAPTPTPPTPTPTTPQNGLKKFEPNDGKVYIGANSQPYDINDFNKAVGISKIAIWGYYTTPDGNIDHIINTAKANNTAPLASWSVTMKGNGVVNNSKDGYIKRQAQEAKAYGKPVFLRPDWEMNGNWYGNWDLTGTSQDLYKRSWRHIVDVFRAEGVTNVAWVWCPNNGTWPSGQRTVNWWPGDDYVDWVCVDAYAWDGNYPKMLNAQDGVEELTRFARSKNKPIMLGEWGPNEPVNSTAAGINAFFDWAERNPDTVKALMYFHFDTFKISRGEHTTARNTFKNRITNNPRYITEVQNR